MAILVSVLTGGSNSHQTTSEEANGVYTDFVSEGVVGAMTNTSGVAPATGGFAVNAQGSPDMTVAVSAGVAYVTGTPSSQNSQTFRVKNSASSNVTISANSSGSTKYDWIYIKLDATNLNTPNTAGDNVATLVASRSSSASTDDGTPPTYGYPLAVVTVANGASTITNSTIRDIRTNTEIGTTPTITGWSSNQLPAVSSVTNNGNRSQSVVFGSTVAALLTPGMRVRGTRTVTAPTQCTDLESGSSNYYNKTSPNKCTFTDDFCAGAWVKLESYGSTMTIVSRNNGTSGWALFIDSSGRVSLNGYNAGLANNSVVLSYQSVPLGKWVHIAAQLDMSAFTATTTTSYIMLDGLDVPASVSRAGTNPTALVQAGNLEVGSYNGGTSPFDGKLAQVFFSTAKVTQAQIRSEYMCQSIAASATNLGSAYSFNNSITDLNTTTPNDLTAQNSAVATNADSPFGLDANGVPSGTYEWGIVTKVATTTATIQFPEGSCFPTSGGVTTVDISPHKAPFGMPVDENRWVVQSDTKTLTTQGSPVQNTWYNIGSWQITIPIGTWILNRRAPVGGSDAGATAGVVNSTFSTGAATESNPDTSIATYHAFNATGANADDLITSHFSRDYISLSSATLFYHNIRTQSSGIDTLSLRGDLATTSIRAVPAYL